MKNKIHYLYVIASIEDNMPVAPCKIGITSNLPSRLSGLQTGSAKKLEIISAIPIPGRNLVKVLEAEMHSIFSDFRLVGEWFDICPVDAAIGVCTIAHDGFMAIFKNDEAKAFDALRKLGIINEIGSAYKYLDYCKANNVPLKSRMVLVDSTSPPPRTSVH
jgi:hypothetical protein